MIFRFLPLRICNLRFRCRDMRQKLDLYISQIAAKSVDLKHRLKIKFLFNDDSGYTATCFLELLHLFSEPLQHGCNLKCVEFKRIIVTAKSPLFTVIVTF